MRTTLIQPGEFEPHRHWYEKALNATIHPMIHFFLHLSMDRIVNRYCHLHPQVDPQVLQSILLRRCKQFLWAGADLFNVTSAGGKRQMVIIENNSCPSGQKSMPLFDDTKEQGGYRFLVEQSFKPYVRQRRQTVKGGLAVVYDKNPVEASGYAAVMADVFQEPVHYVFLPHSNAEPALRFGEDRIMEVRDPQGQWVPIRAAFRYLTQKPWNHLPTYSRTRIYNPITACLAGGRNKMVAAKAYDLYNSELAPYNLKINTPETIWDVSKNEIPLWVQKMGGQAVIKVPYSNAGQGVFTIVSRQELEQFLAMEFDYDQFIVQSLIGNYRWSSVTRSGRLYHVGTIPNTKGNTFVADIRMMVCSTPEGIRPLSVYARRAAAPLADQIESGTDSWAMLGTNLSVKQDDGSWGSDTKRLLLMDRRDFNKLGLGLDDLIEAYIQTVLSMVAIDKMAETLTNKQGRFRMRLFRSLNDDRALLEEVFN